MKEKILTVPNIITSFRILGSLILLLFIEPFTREFFVLYTLCGLSDVVDGVVARATKSTTEFGSKLDSVADLLFYFVLFICIIEKLLERLPLFVWIMGISAVVIRIASYLTAAIKYHRFASIHTYMNKATGAVIFTVPYFILTNFLVAVCVLLGIVTIIASLEELLIHLTSKKYDPNRKTILRPAAV